MQQDFYITRGHRDMRTASLGNVAIMGYLWACACGSTPSASEAGAGANSAGGFHEGGADTAGAPSRGDDEGGSNGHETTTGGASTEGARSGGGWSGGATTGGTKTGGAHSGGNHTGGASSGNTGGSHSGASNTGGAHTGGAHSGGSSTGGGHTGGTSTGGGHTGGTDRAGADSGGADTGGGGAAGASSGGSSTSGGSDAGGADTAGTSAGGDSSDPHGFTIQAPVSHTVTCGLHGTVTYYDASYICTLDHGGVHGFVYFLATFIGCDSSWGNPPMYSTSIAEISIDGEVEALESATYSSGGNHHVDSFSFVHGSDQYIYSHSSIDAAYHPCHNMDCLQVSAGGSSTVTDDGCTADRTIPVVCSTIESDGTYDDLSVDPFDWCPGDPNHSG
jgi:hypothetical protein